MNVVVSLEQRFQQTPDGTVWTQTAFPYRFWTRYLEVFDRVRVVARVQQISSVPDGWTRASGAGVMFAAIPYYIGPWQYLLRLQQIKHTARAAVSDNNAVILRVSSRIATCILPMLRRTGHPYGVEVVADPYDVFAPGSVRHPLRPFFRWLFPRQLRSTCVRACAAAYVTQSVLQRRYPPASQAFSTYYSDVELSEAAFAQKPRPLQGHQRSFTLIHVGTMAQLYKAQDVLLDAVASCVREGLDLKLLLVGDGQYRSHLEAQAIQLDLGDRVCFLGQLTSGEAVRAQLQSSDLFVLPSHQEGLPRAMIEAMAQGLPCIGSTVGGIPELLPIDDLVPPGDVAALANKIREILTNPQRMAEMSAHNLAIAQAYREAELRERRVAFYRFVREQTEAWIKQLT